MLGQPNLNVTVDRKQAARYQINVADVQDAIQTAVGGNALTQVLQGEARYDLVMRYLPQYRDTKEAIENIRLLSPIGRTRIARTALQDRANGWRFGNLSRRESALYRHQVQRPRSRPRQRRRGGDQEGERTGQIASGTTSTGKANTRARREPTRGCLSCSRSRSSSSSSSFTRCSSPSSGRC